MFIIGNSRKTQYLIKFTYLNYYEDLENEKFLKSMVWHLANYLA